MTPDAQQAFVDAMEQAMDQAFTNGATPMACLALLTSATGRIAGIALATGQLPEDGEAEVVAVIRAAISDGRAFAKAQMS